MLKIYFAETQLLVFKIDFAEAQPLLVIYHYKDWTFTYE